MSIISGLYNPASPYYSAFNSLRSISRGDYDHHDSHSSDSSHDYQSSKCSSKMKELNALRVANNKREIEDDCEVNSSTSESITKPGKPIPVMHVTDEFRLSNGCNAELMTEESLKYHKCKIEMEFIKLCAFGLRHKFYDCSERVTELNSDLMKINTCLDRLNWTKISESFV